MQIKLYDDNVKAAGGQGHKASVSDTDSLW